MLDRDLVLSSMAYAEECDARLKRLMETTHCKECEFYNWPSSDGFPEFDELIGWCDYNDYFTQPFTLAADIDCEAVVPAG